MNTYLNCQFTCGGQHDGLNFSASQSLLTAQIFSHGQGETKGFARASQIARNNILSVEDRIEAKLLNGEEVLDAI